MAEATKASFDLTVEKLCQSYRVKEFCKEFMGYCRDVRGYSKTTMATRQTHLNQFCNFLERNGIEDINIISNTVVDAYFTDFLTCHSQNTANTGRRIIRAFIKWVNDYKELNTPAKPENIRLVKVRDELPKAISKSVIIEVISKADNYQDALMIATMFEAGLRISEVVNLKSEDIHDNTMKTLGKGNIERMVYVSKKLTKSLKRFANDNNRTGYIFLNVHNYHNREGRMRSDTACRRIQKCFMDVSGLKMHPHQLRHSLAICLLENGADLVTIQRVLGHADISTTMVYLKVHNEFIRNGYNQHLGGSVLT